MYDVLARWDGEEFVALLPETPSSEATYVVNRMRQIIGATPIQLESGEILYITFSAGVCALGDNFDAALRRADQMLRSAKQAGRNRVAWG